MRVNLEVNVDLDVLQEMATAAGKTPSELAEELIIRSMLVFMQGQQSGLCEGHKQAIAAIDNFVKRSESEPEMERDRR